MKQLDIDALIKKMNTVPFGNSQFQIKYFIDGQEGTARRARTIILQLDRKIKALKECEFRRERINIDIDEIKEKLDRYSRHPSGVTNYDKRRLDLELREKEWTLQSELKLIDDAMVEIQTYLSLLEELPELKSRIDFEKKEFEYWVKRLTDDATREYVSTRTISVGTIKALNQIGFNVIHNEDKFEIRHINNKQKIGNDEKNAKTLSFKGEKEK